MKYREEWELETIPEPIFQSEAGKRRQAKGPPRPKKLRPCEFCGMEFGGREMQLHLPRCAKRPNSRKIGEQMNAVTLEQTRNNIAAVASFSASRKSGSEYLPHVEAVVRAKKSMQKLEKYAGDIANLAAASKGRERTEDEEKALESLYDKFRKEEYKLIRYFDPESSFN